MQTALDAVAKTAYTLVEFRYGNPAAPSYWRITDWNEAVSFNGNVYSPVPAMEITIAVSTLAFKEKPSTVEMPLIAGTLSESATSGEATAPIYARITEIVKDLSGALQGKALYLYSGRVVKGIRHFQGRPDRVLFEILSTKGQLNVPIGLQCNPQCLWTLGGSYCDIDIPAMTYTSTVNSISGKKVVLGGGHLTTPDRIYHRGYLRRNGLVIGIRDWKQPATNDFELIREPPAEWLGNTVSVVPGCDKTLEACRARFNNEDRFAGLGRAMPYYNPLFEDPYRT